MRQIFGDSRRVLLWNLIWPHWGNGAENSEGYRAVAARSKRPERLLYQTPRLSSGLSGDVYSDAQRDNP